MKKILDDIQNSWNDKRYGRLVLYALLMVMMFALACIGVYLVILLIARYIDLIMITTAVVLGIYFYFHERKEKLLTEREEIERRELLRQQQLASELAESNYQLVERAMFIVIQEMHESLRVKKPAFLSEIATTPHYYQRRNITIYRFSALKEGDIDLEAFRTILQGRLSQKLNAIEFDGINQSVHIYDGVAYPLLQVIEPQDLGININWGIVWTNDSFCEEQNMKLLARQQVSTRTVSRPRDRDF